jgi:hypothetical protein
MARSARSTLFLASLVGLSLCASAEGCGGKSDRPPATSASASGDVSSLAIFVDKGHASSDSHEAKAIEAVAQQLARSGYRVVDTEKEADVFAVLDIKKTKEPSIIQVQVGGKTLENYRIDVLLALVDRDNKPVEKVQGSYSTSDGEADQDEVAALVNKLSESKTLAAYATTTKKAREERQKREADAKAAQEAEQAARDAAEAKRKADRETRERNQEAIRQIEKLKKEIEETIKAAEQPVPADKLAAFKSRADELKGPLPDTSRYYAHLDTTFRVENAWWQPENEAPKTIAGLIGGEVASSGTTDGKKLSVPINAKVGHCYTVLMRYKTVTGKEEIKDLAWSAKGGNSSLQRYFVRTYGDGTQRIEGTCVTKDVAVTLTADLVFPGTKNGLRYVVLDTTKAKFPLYIATYMGVHIHDACDTDSWLGLWTDPIPGSIAYEGKEPFLITDPEEAGRGSVRTKNATLGDASSGKNELVTEPPKGIKFATQFQAPRCSRDDGEGADSQRFAKCHAQITAKYKGQWDAAERAEANAITYLAKRAARAQLDRIGEAEENDRERQCKPIEDQIAKKWEQTFNKIVDQYTDSPRKSPIDRVGELASQDKGARD